MNTDIPLPPENLFPKFPEYGPRTVDEYFQWHKIWMDEILERLPMDINMPVIDFLTAIGVLVYGRNTAIDETVEVVRGPGESYVIFNPSREDYFWIMTLAGWSDNTTMILDFTPYRPNLEHDDRKIDDNDRWNTWYGYSNMALIFDNLLKPRMIDEQHGWFTEEMAKEIRQTSINKVTNLEEIFQNDPPEWIEVVKRFLQYKTDRQIAYELNLTEGYVSQILHKVRQVHPELRLYRGRPEKHTNTKGSIKKTKEQIKI